MGFVSKPFDSRDLGCRGKYQIDFQTDPVENLDILILDSCPQKECVPFTNTRSYAAVCNA